MKYTRYSKYSPDAAEDIDLQELMNRMSDFFLQSGFDNQYGIYEMDMERSREQHGQERAQPAGERQAESETDDEEGAVHAGRGFVRLRYRAGAGRTIDDACGGSRGAAGNTGTGTWTDRSADLRASARLVQQHMSSRGTRRCSPPARAG